MNLLIKKYILNNQKTLILREKKTIYISLRDLYINLSKYLIININILDFYLRN